jgi:septal ring-binding cell division protein DamX
MYCPRCKTEIKQTNKSQCPECNGLLLENVDRKILKNEDKPEDKSKGKVTTGEVKRRDGEELDEFADFLEGITEEVDQILFFEDEDSSKSEPEGQDGDEPAAEKPDGVVDFLKDLDEGVDRILSPADKDAVESESEAQEEDEPTFEKPSEVIELTDDIETETPEFDEHAEEHDTETHEEALGNELIAEETDEVIELTDFVKPEIKVKKVGGEWPEIQLKLLDEPDAKDDETIEEKSAGDMEFPDFPDIQIPGEEKDFEETSEEDVEPVDTHTAGITAEAPIQGQEKSKRISMLIPALTGVAVLAIAMALGGKFYLKLQNASAPPAATQELANLQNSTGSSKTLITEAEKLNAEKMDLIVTETQTEKQVVKQQKPDAAMEAAVEPELHTESEASEKQIGGNVRQPDDGHEIQTKDKNVALQAADSDKDLPPVVSEKNEAPKQKEEVRKTPISTIHPDTSDTAAKYTAKEKRYFTLQVATLKNKAFVDSNLTNLKKKGYPAYVVEKKYDKGLVLYKLRIGKYKTKADAKKAAGLFYSKEQMQYVIVQSEIDISL